MARVQAASAGIAIAALLAWASAARAEECGCSPRRPHEGHAELKVGSLAANYENARYTGDYQGIYAQGSFTQGRFGLNFALPWYQVERNGLVEHGLGDVTFGASAVVLRPEDSPVALSASFGAMAPTGDPDADLGMGHWMVMPGLLAWRDLGRFTPEASVQYSRAIQSGSGGHHDHGSTVAFPIVDPQNASELRFGAGTGLRVSGAVALHAGVLAALPIATENGVERYVATGGLSFTAGPTRFAAELQQPFASTPFDTKVVVSAAARM